MAPLVLVALALIGSLALPARQTWLITRTLRESAYVLAPARLLVGQIQTGLTRELVALQSYALDGDDANLQRYETTASRNRQRIATLHQLAAGFDPASAARADTLQNRVSAWHRSNDSLLAKRRAPSRFAAVLELEGAQYDSSMDAIADLSSDLATAAAARDDHVRELERRSIASNALLVLAALVATGGVAILTVRERRLTTTLRRRVEEESALRQAAEALAGAYTMDDVTRGIADAALQAVAAGRGAFVELVERLPDDTMSVVVRAAVGEGPPPVGAAVPLEGSCAQAVMASGEPMLIQDLASPKARRMICTMPDGSGSAIVVPLGSDTSTTGALFVLSAASGHFHAGDVARAGIFGHLAALAYEKVRLLDEAHEQRHVLESVMQSRSRLMRGFSHDVKNPISAADGFAELLTMGVYGALTAEQQSSIDRMRRSVRTALVLIDDLHELARAETGHLPLTIAPLDVAELARSLVEEYQAAAQGRGLSLCAGGEDSVVVEADSARVRQIIANLLSNATKYTDRGSITVRVHRHDADPSRGKDGWVAVDVADTGTGIPAEKRDYIFEEFNRLDTGTTKGAGLGLAISKLLALSMGGDLSVTSEPGSGSTFTLRLPLATTDLHTAGDCAALPTI